VKNRYTLLLAAGGAAWGFCALATAQTPYFQNFEPPETLAKLTEWSFGEIVSGSPVLLSATLPGLKSTLFLGEFGGSDAGAGDVVYLNLDLPQDTVTVRLQFDAYLLRTWDGIGTLLYSGPDTFGYGISGRDPPLLRSSFSNGAGVQDYCPFSLTPTCEPTWGSDPLLKNELGFKVELEPAKGSTVPAKGTPMSLVYHFDSGPISYSSASIAFKFFSENLQVRDDLLNKVIDESWGLDNVRVTAQVVPETQTYALLLTGLLLLTFAAHRRSRLQR